MRRIYLQSCWVVCLLVACAGGITNRVDVDSEDNLSDTGTGSKDLRAVTSEMVRSLITLPQLAGAASPPRVALLRVENRTNEILDTQLFTTKMRTLLIKHSAGRIVFVDRSNASAAAIQAERNAKREGSVSATDTKQVSGADFFLTGEIASIDKAAGGTRSTYTRFSFRLTDAESSDILWEDEFEMKKVAVQGVWDM